MHPKSNARQPRLWWGLSLLAGLAGTVAYGQPPAPPPEAPAEKDSGVGEARVDVRTGSVLVAAGAFVRYDPKLPAIPIDILVDRQNVVRVKLDPNNPKVLLLTGKEPGLAQVTLLFKDLPRIVYEVVVQPDLALLRNMIRQTVPTANVEVTPGIGNVIILSGYATSPQDVDIITRLAVAQTGGNVNNVINAIQVGGVQQVQIDVVIASVNRNEVRSRGFDFSVSGKTVTFSSLVSGLLTPPTGFGSTAATFGSNANLQLGIAPAGFFAALQALRTEGLAKFLGEPRVVTQTGRPAFFRAGGQQAILSSTSGITGPGVQLVPFGTELEVVPIVYGNGQIWLEINPRISAVSQGLGITLNGAASPGFTEQQVRCAVMLESGQTYRDRRVNPERRQCDDRQNPVLGDLPYVGTLFSSISYNETETELVILVTPRLVHPMDCNQVPKRLPGRETRSPDDYELFLENILEAPRGQRKVWNGRCYNAAYKCDPTVASFPCAGNVCYGPNGTPLPGGACGPSRVCRSDRGCDGCPRPNGCRPSPDGCPIQPVGSVDPATAPPARE
jgi:pilus assembly protein CpaC